MLTDIEKEKIKQEEIYRSEVTKILHEKEDASKSISTRIWEFLNKPFTIWVCSSLVVGILSFVYANFKQHYTENQLKKDKISKLDIEISGRIKMAATLVWSSSKNEELLNGIIVLVGSPNKIPLSNTFPEFKERNLYSLLFELRALIDSTDIRPIKKALKGCIKLNDYVKYYVLEMNDSSFLNKNDLTKDFATKTIKAYFIDKRWKNTIDDEKDEILSPD